MLLYLTFWFPSHERARAVAKFMTATSLAGVVGGPLSSALLKLDGVYGLSGWQWLFLFEGVPTILVGISVLFVLKDGPDRADWLKTEERAWLKSELQKDQERYGATQHHHLLDAFRLPAVWLMAGVYIIIQIGVYIVNLWMPLILSGLASGDGSGDASLIARYATVPYLLAAIFTVLLGWTSDRWNERRGHLAGCMALAAVGFAWAAHAQSIAVALCAMSLVAIGLWSTMGPFWALTTRMIGGAAAAGGVAMITMIGALGGFVGPYVTGLLRDATHSFAGGLYLIGGLALVAAMLSLAVRRPGHLNAS
jgi:sugar phosphate permease